MIIPQKVWFSRTSAAFFSSYRRMGVYQGSKNRNQQAGLWGDFPIVNMRSFFSNVVSVFSFIGFVTYLGIGLKAIYWYTAWWDRIIQPPWGSFFALITYPLFPAAVLIEGLTNRWPVSVSNYFWISVVSLLTILSTSVLSKKT
ncbi:MAG TPA: hypothetical protein EYQ50_09605 [Verrucomicrobiales bacterium]|nr:hypothetical protein [Verrucomicrobiales bacterium]